AYTIVAIDYTGLESVPAKPVSRKRIASSVKSEIKNISGKADRVNNKISLSWKYEEEGVSQYLIYRAQEKEGLVLYKQVKSSEGLFTDVDLKTNTVYTYRVQAKFEDGALS